jgi:hypothetical protein
MMELLLLLEKLSATATFFFSSHIPEQGSILFVAWTLSKCNGTNSSILFGYCVKLNGIPAIECIPEVIAAFAVIHPCIFY